MVLSSGMSTPLTWLSGSLAMMPAHPWGVELSVAGSPLVGKADLDAGSLTLRGYSVAAFATLEPITERPFGLSLGLGGGALHPQEEATSAPGFDVTTHSPTVGLVSARARLFHRFGPVYLGLTIDPGILVPAVKVDAGPETALRIGRPWVSMQASVGLER